MFAGELGGSTGPQMPDCSVGMKKASHLMNKINFMSVHITVLLHHAMLPTQYLQAINLNSEERHMHVHQINATV